MIQHIRQLLILLLILCFSCKNENVSKSTMLAGHSTNKELEQPKNNIKTFTFYKAFSFCENRVEYFTEQEAKDLYADKIITLNIEETGKENQSSNFTQEKLRCICENLDISNIIDTKFFKTKDVFPFDNILFLENKYAIVARDGYFFVFIIQSENKKNNTSKELSPFKGFELLVNHKLTGLSIIDTKKLDPYKKYGLDFSTVCVCDSPSMYIDTNSEELIIFNYCDSNQSINTIENKTIFNITKTVPQENKIIITTSKNLEITCEKSKNSSIFKIQFKGDFPKKYVGNDLKSFFTTTPEKFKKIDCGDFGG
jgi:hypothetical protein